MLKDISIHNNFWMTFDDLKHIVNCRFTTLEKERNIAEHLAATRAAWVAGSLKSGALKLVS